MIFEPRECKRNPCTLSSFALKVSSKYHKRGLKMRAVCLHYPPRTSPSTLKTNLSLMLCGPERTQLPDGLKTANIFPIL